MRFFIVDDSAYIRAMLANIIEDHDLGEVAGEAEDGSEVYADILAREKIDILLIDLLMPNRDGIETVREISASFSGKIVMISQVEAKELIGEAYSLGIDHYITKPINQLEVIQVLKKVSGYLQLEKSLKNIHESLSFLGMPKESPSLVHNEKSASDSIVAAGKNVLLDLGIYSESGGKDLLDMVSILYTFERDGNKEMPPLKELFTQVMAKRLGSHASADELAKEARAGEQRVRRAIHQALDHIASLGLTDYSNPKFEKYAPTLFDYTNVRIRMLELENKTPGTYSNTRINIKKFVQVLYNEALEKMN
ncbi:transcriptional regulator [Neobacillus piezotolerans]|uniref:Transcriptional regulator n=1 Tax=Neobacillus piezotolerans TaxID=2259171 RepID=A0A3D8GU97_9BACI|nr:response regulator [Neobacillus piezotolerans]RDU37977.1 transcriptional regulator [Neobacillus piezotolerans]